MAEMAGKLLDMGLSSYEETLKTAPEAEKSA
jgi:hypothetical protein